ncbi:MAG: hypothetical protein C4527_25645 [Candidatus Omnitrophota bacterium]|nr:MAG: hypothetical protein C4527_25645 [Candidatus Omnitrophota bacterium]
MKLIVVRASSLHVQTGGPHHNLVFIVHRDQPIMTIDISDAIGSPETLYAVSYRENRWARNIKS